MTQPGQPQEPQQPFTLPEGAKPTWRGLRSGERTPLKEFIGRMVGYTVEPSDFGGTNIVIRYDNLQVMQADAPYPYAHGEIQAKYSDRTNSAWGRLGRSFATALGTDIEQMDIDHLVNQWWHMTRLDNQEFGKNRQTGAVLLGTVWTAALYQQMGGQSRVTSTPTPPAAATPPIGAISAEAKALSLLHRKTLPDFFSAALADDEIHKDAGLVAAIVNRQFVAANIQAGKVVENPDGTYTVTGMPF